MDIAMLRWSGRIDDLENTLGETLIVSYLINRY
jgi:hypothetical protein